MLEAGRDAWFDNSKVLENARFTWEEVSGEESQIISNYAFMNSTLHTLRLILFSINGAKGVTSVHYKI